ncbi:peptidase S8/S53 domain-containing protein, partial [Blyttiomyces helicus]
PDTTEPVLNITHLATGVAAVHSLGGTGRGVLVAVIDTGVDYTHPALGRCFGPACLVAFGRDFAGDSFQGDGDTPQPKDDPMDWQLMLSPPRTHSDGHGTHVAGILAANDSRVLGVSPGIKLGAYKIFGCTGGTTSDLIIKAM